MTDNEGRDGGGDTPTTEQQLDEFDTTRVDTTASENASTTEEIQRQEPSDPANDPLFVREGDEDGSSPQIWVDRDLLSIGTVPGPDRIVGRDAAGRYERDLRERSPYRPDVIRAAGVWRTPS